MSFDAFRINLDFCFFVSLEVCAISNNNYKTAATMETKKRVCIFYSLDYKV